LLSLFTTLFFLWGFITVLNDILIPHLKNVFDLTYFKAMLIQFSFFEKPIEKSELVIEIERHKYTSEYLELVRDFYLKM